MKDQIRVANLKKVVIFDSLVKRLFLSDTTLTGKEKQFLLSVAILLLRKYQKNTEYQTCFEFAYCIILKYSLLFHDWTPLYDFAVNFGFYPIANSIMTNLPDKNQNLIDEIINIATQETFSHDKKIETKEQNILRNRILSSTDNNISYIAPTSFGKSQIIIEHIKQNLNKGSKFAIIVPSKSLLLQTFFNVKNANIGIRIFVHDEMYVGEDRFIAVLTQERALRLLDKNDIAFDFLYIDEAHKLLDFDSRSVLLARLIQLNLLRNPNTKILYLSPMVQNSSSLSITGQSITQQKINYNMKEPSIFEFQNNGDIRIYNRFFDVFYDLPSTYDFGDYLKYICDNKRNKNFIYLYSPRKIEKFAKCLYEKDVDTNVSHEPAIQETIRNLKTYVHDDFYITKYLDKGIIYIHGKIPDNIKDYLEYKFNTVPEIKVLIANNVILEGVNLPIDALFVVQPHGIKKKSLVNLIGRVNRLNLIFTENIEDLSKLQPTVHFVNNGRDYYSYELENKVKLLRTSDFEDEVKNPLLEEFDSANLENEKDIAKSDIIKANNELVFSEQSLPEQILKQNMLKIGLDIIYKTENNRVAESIYAKIQSIQANGFHGSLLEMLQFIFIQGLEDLISDHEFLRLRDPHTILYYEKYLSKYSQKSLKERISLFARYLRSIRSKTTGRMYIGKSFGEIDQYGNNASNDLYYIDLRSKSYEDLINIAVIKIKIEEDFISFKLNKFFQLMFDYGLISSEQYNMLIYGTNDTFKLTLAKQGLPLSIINKIVNDGQQNNINVDSYGNLKYTTDFETYMEAQDDFFKFTLRKIL